MTDTYPEYDTLYRLHPKDPLAVFTKFDDGVLQYDGKLVPVEPLDTNNAERDRGAWFEVGPIFLPDETRDKFRVAVFDAASGVEEDKP